MGAGVVGAGVVDVGMLVVWAVGAGVVGAGVVDIRVVVAWSDVGMGMHDSDPLEFLYLPAAQAVHGPPFRLTLEHLFLQA